MGRHGCCVGYSWLRGDQCAAPKVTPYWGAMMPRPLEIKWSGMRQFHNTVADPTNSEPPQDWVPYLGTYDSHRRGTKVNQQELARPNAATDQSGGDPTDSRAKSGGDPTAAPSSPRQVKPAVVESGPTLRSSKMEQWQLQLGSLVLVRRTIQRQKELLKKRG